MDPGARIRVRLRVDAYDTLARKAGLHAITNQAELHGLSRSTMHRLRAGSVDPSAVTVMVVARDLGVDVGELFELVDAA